MYGPTVLHFFATNLHATFADKLEHITTKTAQGLSTETFECPSLFLDSWYYRKMLGIFLNILYYCFEQWGKIVYLEKSLTLSRQCFSLLPIGDHYRSTCLDYLACPVHNHFIALLPHGHCRCSYFLEDSVTSTCSPIRRQSLSFILSQ